jgi:lipoprotein-releasing system permease protein
VNLPFFIARRVVVQQKGTFSSFIIRLAVIATALSVATMILAVAIIAGFKYEIREKLFSFWGHIHITPYNPNLGTIITPTPIQKSPVLEQQVKAVDGVQKIEPFAIRPVILSVNTMMEGLQLKGVDKSYRIPEAMHLKGSGIDYSDTAYAHQIILSETTAGRLNIKAGDEIELYFLEPGSTFPRIRKVEVGGLFHSGMDEIDKDYGLCDIRLLQRINNWAPDQINGYQITLDNDANADSVREYIFDKYVDPPLTANTMGDIFPNIFDWLKLIDVNGRVILIIMSIVAVMNLAVALLILIIEQAKMVGILKAQGMSQGAMQQIFMYHAGFIAAVGILAGNVLALGICWAQSQYGILQLSESTYYMQYVPVKVYWWHPVLIDVATIILCILCMWLPSLYIRRIQPVKVLQFK